MQFLFQRKPSSLKDTYDSNYTDDVTLLAALTGGSGRTATRVTAVRVDARAAVSADVRIAALVHICKLHYTSAVVHIRDVFGV